MDENTTYSLIIKQNKYVEVFKQVVHLQEMMLSCSTAFLIALTEQDLNTCQNQLNDITAALSALEGLNNNEYICFIPCSYHAMFQNISYTIDEIVGFINEGQFEKAVDRTELQLINFIKDWCEDTYFWLMIYPDSERVKQYYKLEFAKRHKNTYLNRGEKFLVSIFIPVYNKLEYTKRCLESLYRHTDLKKYPCELILLNDGSTDGTEEYFKTLGVRKVLTLKKNVKTMIFSLMYRVCEGKYAVFVNNDTILTENWLDNLLACIQSGPDIISAVPSTPNTSNHQSMREELTPENAEKKAKDHNHSDPLLWEERTRLMPVIALYDMDKVDEIGFADRFFFTMEFWDDDFSLRARRAGYKQILCRDTWCYHFGSVSGGADQAKNRTLERGRELFLWKNQVDAWGRDFCYNLYLQDILNATVVDQPSEVAILGIDVGFGDEIRQLKNELRKQKKNIRISLLVSEKQYKDDMNSCASIISAADSGFDVHRYIPDGSYQYIYIGNDLTFYSGFAELLKSAKEHLSRDGILIFYVCNPYYYKLKQGLEQKSLLNGKLSVTLINFESMVSMMKEWNLSLQMTGIENRQLGDDWKVDSSEYIERYLVVATRK